MNASDLHPELSKPIQRLPRLPFTLPALLPLTRVVFNLASNTKAPKGSDVRMLTDGTARVDVSFPPGKASGAAVLWIHGGGHIAGTPKSLTEMAARLSRELGVVVAMPHYRLSPKHPFPADLDDCHAAWIWLQRSAEGLGVDPTRVAVVGNSAGGGLAAALVQRLRDEGGVQPSAQVLFYPMLDDRTAAREELDGVGHFVWSNKANRVAWSSYLAPHRPGAEDLPAYAAPARSGSLDGLPPAWLGIGDVDLFLDEGLDYAARLEAAGVPCDLVRVAGAPHAFEVLVPDAEVSQKFVQSAFAFLREQLTAPAETAT